MPIDPPDNLNRLADDFYRFRADTSGRLTELEKQSAVEQVHRTNVEKRLTGIEDNTKWVIRLIVGAFLAAAATFALNGGFNVG